MPRPSSSTNPREDFLRHAAGVLVCPRCGIPLRGGDHATGIAWKCKACGGQSLNFSQFRRMVPGHGANDIWLTAAAHPVKPRQRTRCPECLAAMDAVPIPFRGQSIELDICRPCQRLWLDRNEGAGVSSLTITNGPPVISSPQSNPTPQQQRDRLFSMLEDFADYSDSRRENKSERDALIFAIPASVVTFLCLWTLPLRFQIYIAWGVGFVVYVLRKFRR